MTSIQNISGSCIASYYPNLTSHVSDSLFSPTLSGTVFHKAYIHRSYFHFPLVPVTLPHFRRKKLKSRKFCMPVIDVRLACFVHSQHTVFCNFWPWLARVTPEYPWWCSWKYKFKSSQNRNLFACRGWHWLCCAWWISVCQAYEVCYISIWKQLEVTGV